MWATVVSIRNIGEVFWLNIIGGTLIGIWLIAAQFLFS